MGYVPSLTGLRALAAALVFFHHDVRLFHKTSGPVADILNSGNLGVAIFFTLSGYLITRSYFEKITTGKISFGRYWWKRAARILPAYWILLMVCMYFKYTRGRAQPVSELVTNFTLTQAFWESTIWSGIFPAWSLTVEECFYLLAPILFLAIRPRGSKPSKKFSGMPRIAVVLGVATLGLWFLGEFISKINSGGDFLATPGTAFEFNLLGRFPEFALGMATAFAVSRLQWKNRVWSDLLFGASLILIGTSLYLWKVLELEIMPIRGVTPFEKARIFWLVAIATSAFILASVNRSRFSSALFGNPLVEYLGRISFCFYLIQEGFILRPFYEFLVGIGLDPGNPLVSFTCANLLAATIYQLVEKPAHRWLAGDKPASVPLGKKPAKVRVSVS